MALPAPILDGNVVYGSQILTFGGINFVGEQLTVSRHAVRTDITDDDKVPTRGIWMKQRRSGSGILQVPSGTTAAPAVGAQFSIAPAGGGAPKPFYLTGVSEAFTQDGALKFPIEFDEILDGNQIAAPQFLLDGTISTAIAIGPIRTSYDQIYNTFWKRQTFVVYAPQYSHLPAGSTLPSDASYRIVEETEPQEWSGTPLVVFDRVYVRVPPDNRHDYGSQVKTIKILTRYWAPIGSPPTQQCVAVNVTTVQKVVRTKTIYTYTTDPFNQPRGEIVPDVTVISSGGFSNIYGTGGFPDAGPVAGNPGVSNASNDYEHFLGYTYQRWRGDIFEIGRITG